MRSLKMTTLMLAAACVINARNVAVFPPEVTNLDAQSAEALGVIMAQSYGRAIGQAVLGPNRILRAHQEHHTSDLITVQSVAHLNLDEYIVIRAVALSKKILIEVILYDYEGMQLYHADMTAITLDDFPVVCDRLARALAERVSPYKTMGLNTVAAIETKGKNRAFTEKIKGIRSSVLVPFHRQLFDPMLQVGYHMKFDTERYFIEFGPYALFPSSVVQYDSDKLRYGGFALELGGSYYLMSTPALSPYLGGGLSSRVLLEPGTIGVVPYLQLGCMLMRTSATRLYADLKIGQNVMPISISEYRDYERVTTAYYPTEIGFQIGIGF